MDETKRTRITIEVVVETGEIGQFGRATTNEHQLQVAEAIHKVILGVSMHTVARVKAVREY